MDEGDRVAVSSFNHDYLKKSSVKSAHPHQPYQQKDRRLPAYLQQLGTSAATQGRRLEAAGAGRTGSSGMSSTSGRSTTSQR